MSASGRVLDEIRSVDPARMAAETPAPFQSFLEPMLVPDPGHRTITATTYWNVDWSGAGQSGTITFDLTGSRQITVVELHAMIAG